jgi:hypothetical protein
VVIILALVGVLGQGGAVQAVMVAAIILPVAGYLLYSGGSAVPPASDTSWLPPHEDPSSGSSLASCLRHDHRDGSAAAPVGRLGSNLDLN